MKASLFPHPLRAEILAEAHARPFPRLRPPCRLLHFGFATDAESAARDREQLVALCKGVGQRPPQPDSKHERLVLPNGGLQWEQHAEFTSYTWEFDAASDRDEPPGALAAAMFELPQPGPLLVSIDLHVVSAGDPAAIPEFFGQNAVAASRMDGENAWAATDFISDDQGFVRIVLATSADEPLRTGALAQRLLELETYRMLTLLGLPTARELSPRVRRIEDELVQITALMAGAGTIATNQSLLDRLTALAANLEAETSSSSYRFGATRAYNEIVLARLEAIGEAALLEHPTFAAFLARRLGPAIRTCATMEKRLASLSDNLSRASQLLTTRVEIDLERQNHALLAALNHRTRMQLLLQQTVEGLSVIAISYYSLGVVGYMLSAAHILLPSLNPELWKGVAAPVVVLGVWFGLHRIRKALGGDRPETRHAELRR